MSNLQVRFSPAPNLVVRFSDAPRLTTRAVAQFPAHILGGGNVTVTTEGDTVTISAPNPSGVADGDYGDITVSALGLAYTIDNDVVSNAKLANMAQATIKGRASGAGTGDPTDLTATQVAAIVDSFFLTPTEGDAAYQPLDTDLTQIASLVDPNADRLLFWDDSAGSWAHLTVGTNLSISGTTINATGGGSGTPGGLTTQVQYNDTGAFAGDADFTWVAGSGLTDKQSAHFGPFGDFDNIVYAPADVGAATIPYNAPFMVNYNVPVVDTTQAGAMIVYPSFTVSNTASYISVFDLQGQVNFDSTGDITALTAGNMYFLYGGAGDVGSASGFTGIVDQYGAGLVTDLHGVYAKTYADAGSGGATKAYGVRILSSGPGQLVTDDYGLYVEDMSGIGSGESLNIKSLGAASLNVFEGYVKHSGKTVASLIAAATAGAGARSFVTDATATTFASTVAGLGANNVPVYSDGTNWKIG